MASRESIVVKIGTMTYQLQTGNDEAYVRETAAQADALIRQAAKRYPQVNQVTSTVLALLSAVDSLRQAMAAREQAEAALEQQQALASEAEADLLRVNEQFWEMKKDLLYYRNLCDVYERKVAALQPTAETEGKTVRRKPTQSELQQSFDDVRPDLNE